MPLLLADRTATILNAIRDGFRQPDHGFVGIALVAFIFTLLAVLAVFLVRRSRQEHQENLNSPKELFWELCQAHDLDRTQSRALKRLGKTLALKRFDLLFVRPDLWEDALAERSTDEWRECLSAIRARIFAFSSKSAARCGERHEERAD